MPHNPSHRGSARAAGPPPPPAAEGTAGARSPLGVPAGYTVEQPIPPQFRGVASDVGSNILSPRPGPDTMRMGPRYFSGDELLPASFSPEDIAEIQRDLAAAGLIGPRTRVRVGIWDETTRNAYKNLLETANVYGVSARDALARLASAPAVGGGEGEGRAPLRVRLPHPDEVRQVAMVTARATLGRKLTAEEENAAIAAANAAATRAQTAAYGMAETGGTSVEAPDLRTIAERVIRERAPVEAGAHDLAEVGGDFFDLLDEVGA